MRVFVLVLVVVGLCCKPPHGREQDVGYRFSDINAIVRSTVLVPDTILLGETDIPVRFVFTNLLAEGIRMNDPGCFGQTIFPFMADSTGHELPIGFRAKSMRCEMVDFSLGPKKSKEFILRYNLDDCFNLTNVGVYTLWLLHSGPICDENRRPLTGMRSFQSTKAKIIVKDAPKTAVEPVAE